MYILLSSILQKSVTILQQEHALLIEKLQQERDKADVSDKMYLTSAV